MELALLFMTLPFSIYWCINEKAGIQLSIVFLLSIWVVFLYRYVSEQIPAGIDLRWIAIAVIFTGFIFLRKPVDSLLSKGGYRAYMFTAAAAAFLMIIYRPGVETVLPGGILLGMGTGYCLNKKYIGFKSSDVFQKKGIAKILILSARFLIGMAVLAVIVIRVENIIQNFSGSQNIFLYSFLCYMVISFWVFVAAPWIFIKLRLAGVYNEQKIQENE